MEVLHVSVGRSEAILNGRTLPFREEMRETAVRSDWLAFSVPGNLCSGT